MALGRDVVDAIIREHSYRPITGDVLLIGPPAITLGREEVLELMREHGIAAAASDDTDTGNGAEGGMGADAFFRFLGVDSLHKHDASTADAKGARYFGEPIPDDLKASMDFIIDGGALAHVFSSAAALRNYADMLRPGGRLIAINNLSSHFDPYSMLNAPWYFDYFVSNGFADCKVYVLVYPLGGPTNAFCLDVDCLLDPAREVRTFLSSDEMAVVVFAEKGAASTAQATPTHAYLRSAEEWERYRANLVRIKRNARPHLVRSRGEPSYRDVRGGHLFMQSDYSAVEPPRPLAPLSHVAVVSDPAPGPPPARSELKVLCVGTGRDGTQSLNHMIQHVFTASGQRQSMHEYCCREFYQAFCDFKETGEAASADALKHMVADCPYDSIVGNGYAAILPLFAQHYGRDLKVVHLYRADRDACIDSLIANSEMFPTAYRYYSSSPEAEVKRMAAFHFAEMSPAEWSRLPLREKFGWYYDKTHALVRQHLALFDAHIEIATESLDDDATRRRIADFVGGEGPPPPKTHLNASVIDISSFPKQHQIKMNWLLGRLNIGELAKDDVYALNYFLDKFVAWTGYQITNAPQLGGATPSSMPEIAADLERAMRVINERLREIDALYGQVRDRRGGDPEQ
jgi:SAM-dependent methyltransferase